MFGPPERLVPIDGKTVFQGELVMTSLFLSRRRALALIGLAPAATLPAAPARAARPERAPVRVLWTRVNGEAYYQASESIATLRAGAPVTLRREPDNAYDRRAIEVLDEQGRKLGYVARIDNSAVARMMDAGERFVARVSRVDPIGKDIRLEVDWLPG
jgi:uncharacterized ParB-like nuclease family protein